MTEKLQLQPCPNHTNQDEWPEYEWNQRGHVRLVCECGQKTDFVDGVTHHISMKIAANEWNRSVQKPDD